MPDATTKPYEPAWREPGTAVPAKLCAHPPEKVAADLLEACAPGIQVQWCTICGAVRVLYAGCDR